MSLRQESRYPWFEPRLVTPIVIAAAVVWSAYVVVGGLHDHPKPDPETLPVTEMATRHFQPDKLTFTITVRGKGETNVVAIQDLRDQLSQVHDVLVANEVTDKDLSYEAVQVDQDTTGADDVNAAASTEYEAKQDVVITADVTRGRRMHAAIEVSTQLPTAEVGAATCTAPGADAEATANQLLSEARAKVLSTARQTMKQYGGTLGRLQSAGPGGVEVGSDCDDLVVTATASATYELE